MEPTLTVVGDIILEKLVIHYIFLLFVCHVMCHTFCCWNSLCQCPSWKFYVVPLLRVATERYVKILFVFLLMDVNNEGSSHSYCISNILSIFKNIHWPTITYVTCWGDNAQLFSTKSWCVYLCTISILIGFGGNSFTSESSYLAIANQTADIHQKLCFYISSHFLLPFSCHTVPAANFISN